MDIENVAKIIEENDRKVLSLIHFFNKPHTTDSKTSVYPLFIGGAAQKHYSEIKPLIDLELIVSIPSIKSYVFYRDKLEDFIFDKSEKLIADLKEKIESLERQGETTANLRVISRYNNKISEIEKAKKGFTILLRFSKKIPSNRRIPDTSRKVRNYIVEVLGKYEIETNRKLEETDYLQGKYLLEQLKSYDFYKEYSSTNCYSITPLGLALEEILIKEVLEEKSEEEIAFEKMMEEFGDIDIF